MSCNLCKHKYLPCKETQKAHVCKVGLTWCLAKVLDCLAGILGPSEQASVGACGGQKSKLVKGQTLSSCLHNRTLCEWRRKVVDESMQHVLFGTGSTHNMCGAHAGGDTPDLNSLAAVTASRLVHRHRNYAIACFATAASWHWSCRLRTKARKRTVTQCVIGKCISRQ